MAKIIITVPAEDARPYLEEIQRQIDLGYTSGYVDRETHWSVTFDSDEDHFAS